MMGFVWMALIGAAAFAGMARFGLPRALWSFVGAGLVLGAIGYAWQGSPGLAGRTVAANAEPIDVSPAMTDLRDRMLGRYAGDTAYLVAADAMTRSGDLASATNVILGGIRKYPDSLALWTGLGIALVQHDGGQLSAPALLAFRQAMRLSPRHPAPPFFLGIAYLQQGEPLVARRYWVRAFTLAPKDAQYRQDIAVRLMALDRMIAFAQRQGQTLR